MEQSLSLNPILERRAQNITSIQKSFIGDFEQRLEKGFVHEYIEERLEKIM